MIKITIDSTLDELIKSVSKKIEDMPYILGNELVNTVKDRFISKEYNGTPWKQSINNQNTLIKSGDLRNSIVISKAEKDEIIIEFREVYANIHNEGGDILVTEKMKKYFWAMYYKKKDEYWKGLALKPVGSVIHIPKRQLVGDSDYKLISNIENLLKKFLEE